MREENEDNAETVVTEVSLPSFAEAEEKVRSGTATALEQFIFAQEPAGAGEESSFREGLVKVLVEAQGQARVLQRTPPPVAAINKLPLRLLAPEGLAGYRIVDARGRKLCALFDWYEEGGVQQLVPGKEVRAVGEWMVETLNASSDLARNL